MHDEIETLKTALSATKAALAQLEKDFASAVGIYIKRAYAAEARADAVEKRLVSQARRNAS